MTPERYQRVREIFHQVCDLPVTERAGFLTDKLGLDSDTRAEVESLLRHVADGSDVFEEKRLGFGRALVEHSDSDSVRSAASCEVLPESVGGYRIIRKIGEGGMGVVYEAQQQNPQRRVALKVLRAGVTTPNLLRRFAQEAELLGRVQHPGIAHIYEAGTATTKFGKQPYCAMELVDGEPLSEFAIKRSLTVHQRMRLFAQVCDAVHHAHSRGIIHRDLKPANILVVGQQLASSEGDADATAVDAADESHDYQVKILDFGIARATDADMKVSTIQTSVGQLIGTVPYMSPEQVKGDPSLLDLRSDIYSLGVLLFELMSGRLPYDLANRSIPEAARLIQDADPTRLGSIDRIFRGDVDTIVSKALEKDPSRRYQSAAEMAADIRRYLNDEPLVARPAGTIYQLRKFARRNRGLVTGGCIALIAIVAGLVIAIHQAVVATKARDAAEQREQMRLRQTYLASIAAAALALEKHDVALARRSLATAPESLREWEWDHLVSRLDESLLSIERPGGHRIAAPWFVHTNQQLAVLLPIPEGLALWSANTGDALGLRAAASAIYACDRTASAEVTLESGLLRVRAPDKDLIRDVGALGAIADRITQLAISDGGRFVSCAAGDTLLRLDVASDSLETTPIDNRGTGIDGLAITADGFVAIASALDGAPAIWDIAGGLRPLHDVPGVARSVDVSPDGRLIVLGLQDTTIGLWRVDDCRPTGLGRGHEHAVTGVAFSPTGDRIASVSLDRTVRIWESNDLRPYAVLHGHDRGIWNVRFSPDGSRLATTGEDETIRIWDAQPRLGRHILTGHEGFIYSVTFSSDGRQLASAGWDQAIRLWSMETKEAVGQLPVAASVVTALSFSSDNRFLAWAGDQRFGAWDLKLGTEVIPNDSLQLPPAVTIQRFAFIEGSAIVPLPWTLNPEGVIVWNLASNQFEDWELGELSASRADFISRDGQFAVGVSPSIDAADVRTAQSDSGSPLVILDLACGEARAGRRFSGPYALGMTQENQPIMASRLADDLTRVEVRNLAQDQRMGELVGHTDSVYAIAYSPDGKRIATAGRDSLRLWDAQTFTEIVQMRGHTSFVWSLEFSPDGSVLASGSGDATIRIWDTKPKRGGPPL